MQGSRAGAGSGAQPLPARPGLLRPSREGAAFAPILPSAGSRARSGHLRGWDTLGQLLERLRLYGVTGTSPRIPQITWNRPGSRDVETRGEQDQAGPAATAFLTPVPPASCPLLGRAGGLLLLALPTLHELPQPWHSLPRCRGQQLAGVPAPGHQPEPPPQPPLSISGQRPQRPGKTNYMGISSQVFPQFYLL